MTNQITAARPPIAALPGLDQDDKEEGGSCAPGSAALMSLDLRFGWFEIVFFCGTTGT